MLVSWPLQVGFNGFKMAGSVQYLYAFVEEFAQFDEEFGLIYCPRINMIQRNFVDEGAKAFEIFTGLI